MTPEQKKKILTALEMLSGVALDQSPKSKLEAFKTTVEAIIGEPLEESMLEIKPGQVWKIPLDDKLETCILDDEQKPFYINDGARNSCSFFNKNDFKGELYAPSLREAVIKAVKNVEDAVFRNGGASVNLSQAVADELGL